MSIQLSLSYQILRDRTIVNALINIIANTNRTFYLSEQQNFDGEAMITYNKLKFICQHQKRLSNLYSIKIWSILDIITSALLLGHTFNVIIIPTGQKNGHLIQSSNSIFVTDITEVKMILEMSLFQLQRRCKFQRIMMKSSMICNQNQSLKKIKSMGQRYMNQNYFKSLTIFIRFMKFNTKYYLQRTRKYFMLWVIQYYEGNIQKTNKNIIKEKYLCQISEKMLLKKCFGGWLSMSKSFDH